MGYFFSIFFGTFLLEDLALASALGLVAENKMGLMNAFFACFLGICGGDLLLYAVGWMGGRYGLECRFKSLRKFHAARVRGRAADFLTHSVVISRFLPGTRLPTYLVAGLIKYPLGRFTVLTLVTVFGWVGLAFAVGHSLRSVLADHWLLTVVSILAFLKVIKVLAPVLSDRWERRALRHAWRRWFRFEFWPAQVFYLPIVPYYIYLALKFKSLLAPFYANPEIENGGLLGESKWDFLKHLDSRSPHTLRAIRIPCQSDFECVRELLAREKIAFPFVMKPDVGQRGFGVRIIRNDYDLAEYLLLSDHEMIAQALSQFSGEAGIFYYRIPGESKGNIFSITDKRFPSVVGDGKGQLGDLILRDRRSRVIASTYFARHRERLDLVPNVGEVIVLAECGNHCQGAVFLNGESLNSPALEAAIDDLARRIPGFYLGRIDVRYRDADALKAGRGFEVVEVNGAGSEATHIWDERVTLRQAYSTLFEQWHLLFSIGSRLRRSGLAVRKVRITRFLFECARVYFRKEPLSVSS